MKTKNLILTFAALLIATFGYAQFTTTLMEGAATAHNFADGSGLQDAGATGTNYTFALSTTVSDGNGVCAAYNGRRDD